jgi:opacity protein-like surface antigen
MKAKSFFIIASLAIAGLANAQSNLGKSFNYGIKLGVDVNTAATPKTMDAYQAGVFLQVGRQIYVQPEAYYTLQSGKFSMENSYVRVPLMLGYHVFDIDVLRFNVEAGPTYSKQLVSGSKGFFNWGAGVGVDVFKIITADLRYSFKADDNALTLNTNRMNFTVGLRL